MSNESAAKPKTHKGQFGYDIDDQGRAVCPHCGKFNEGGVQHVWCCFCRTELDGGRNVFINLRDDHVHDAVSITHPLSKEKFEEIQKFMGEPDPNLYAQYRSGKLEGALTFCYSAARLTQFTTSDTAAFPGARAWLLRDRENNLFTIPSLAEFVSNYLFYYSPGEDRTLLQQVRR